MRLVLDKGDLIKVINPKSKAFGETGFILEMDRISTCLRTHETEIVYGVQLYDHKQRRYFKESSLECIEPVEQIDFEEPVVREIKKATDVYSEDYFAGKEFTDLDLSYMDLSMMKVDWCTEFKTCNFEGSILPIQCNNLNFTGCNMKSAKLGTSNCSNYKDCDLENAVLPNGDHEDVVFRNCNMKSIELNGYMRDAEFHSCDLEGATIGPEDKSIELGGKLNLWNCRSTGKSRKTIQHLGAVEGTYSMIVFNDHIQLGCQGHPRSRWDKFTDRAIMRLDGKTASVFWRNNKDKVFQLHDKYKHSLTSN